MLTCGLHATFRPWLTRRYRWIRTFFLSEKTSLINRHITLFSLDFSLQRTLTPLHNNICVPVIHLFDWIFRLANFIINTIQEMVFISIVVHYVHILLERLITRTSFMVYLPLLQVFMALRLVRVVLHHILQFIEHGIVRLACYLIIELWCVCIRLLLFATACRLRLHLIMIKLSHWVPVQTLIRRF